VADWFNDKQNYYRDTTALLEENAALRRQIAEMEAEIRQAREDSAENARLEKLLRLQEDRPDLTSDLEAATVTEHSVTNWAATLTVNKGTSSGVEVDQCVMDETGALVGIVSQVGVNWATILTLVDTDTSLGAQVFRTGDLGLAEGDFSLMGEGRLRLNYLSASSALLGGDLVVTSGLGGYYPSGLVIGSVAEVHSDDSGAAVYAVLKPTVDFDSLSEVFIIKSFDSEA
jgi:rod shape-determining protein MreC